MNSEIKIKLFILGLLLVLLMVQLSTTVQKDFFDVEAPVVSKIKTEGKTEVAQLKTPQLPTTKENEIIFPDIEPVTIFAIEPKEYDYKTRKEVFEGRLNQIKNTYNRFFGENYSPTQVVFGAVQDNKAWWGFNGLVCKGNENNVGRDGLSEESRFIENPLFLFGVDTGLVYIVPDWNCNNIYPAPYKLEIKPKERLFEAEFEMSEYERIMDEHIQPLYKTKLSDKFSYSLDGKNARDFGYEYVFISDFENVEFQENSAADDVYQLRNYLHIGHSCGVEGGCNNGSPWQKELDFKVLAYPAEVTLHLFKNKPAYKNATPDIVYKMYFK